jgi:hypothetical protein
MTAVGKAMAQCDYCGGEIGPNALYCPNCLVPIAQPPRRRRPGTLSLFLGVTLLFGSPCAWVIAGQYRGRIGKAVEPAATVHAASLHTAKAVNQAEALIRQCGPPDHDVSTAYNDPRPPIPFRAMTYSNQHLQFAFVPGGDARIGDPPPYTWTLSGILDTTTNHRLTLPEAADRMGCATSALSRNSAAPSTASAPASDPSQIADSSSPAPGQ